MAFDPSDLSAATLQTMLAHSATCFVDEDADGNVDETTAGVLVNAPPDDVAKVVTDYAAYSQWAPQLTKSKIVSQKSGATDVEFALGFRFAVFSKSIDYTVRYREKGSTVAWENVSGEFPENRGTWSWSRIFSSCARRTWHSNQFDC